MSQLKPATHIPQVDYIRAIASLWVALFHLGGKVLPVLKYGWLGVYMFFLLSGFIICKAMPAGYSLKMAGNFILRRIVRIEPPYIISIAIVLLVNLFLTADYHPDWLNILRHLAYINNFTGDAYISPVYWTLGIEFQYYLFIALCFPLIKSKWGMWLLPVLCIISYFVNIPGATLAGVFPIFVLGIIYYLYSTRQTVLIKALLLSIPVLICCWFQSGWLQTCAGLFALLLLLLPLPGNRVIRFFARISFSLYLTHDAIGSSLVVYLGRHLPKTFLYKGLAFTSGIIVSIAFAYLFYLVVEAPFLRLSKKISYQLNYHT
jgi:peptidoglycan/LPS O-acetylase OafA/YrhL